MDSPRLCSILLNLQQRLGDNDREQLDLYLKNDVPKPVKDDSTLGETLKRMQSLFDQDKINAKDFTLLIDAFKQIRCVDAVNLLEEHQRRMVSKGLKQSSQSLALIMPSHIQEVIDNHEYEDPYVMANLVENDVDHHNMKKNDMIDGENITINEDKQKRSSSRKPSFCVRSLKNKWFVLPSILFILTLVILIVVLIERNQSHQTMRQSNKHLLEQQETFEQLNKNIAELQKQNNQTIKQLNDHLLQNNAIIKSLNKTFTEYKLERSMASTDHKASDPNHYHFESYLQANFLGEGTGKTPLNGVSNLVAYLNFPKGHHLYGTFSVTLTGGFNWQPTHGILCKRFHVIYHATQGLVAQTTEITDSSGLLPSQWKIGDLDANALRIPIYHLVATGNVLTVKLEGTTIHGNYPSHDITISDPVVVNNINKP